MLNWCRGKSRFGGCTGRQGIAGLGACPRIHDVGSAVLPWLQLARAASIALDVCVHCGSSVQFKDMLEEELDEHASHAAEYCWLTARSDLSSERLFKGDFEALLPDAQDAEFTFSLFDLDGDGCAAPRPCPVHALPCLAYSRPKTNQLVQHAMPTSASVSHAAMITPGVAAFPGARRIPWPHLGCCVWLPLLAICSVDRADGVGHFGVGGVCHRNMFCACCRIDACGTVCGGVAVRGGWWLEAHVKGRSGLAQPRHCVAQGD